MASMEVTREQREIASMLKLDARDLAKRIALNSANAVKPGEYVSMNVRDMPLIAAHARSESFQPIPAGIAAMPKTLTKDAVSDTATLAEIARQLGIEPTEFARRLAAQPADGEG
jgi:hypothetical protein